MNVVESLIDLFQAHSQRYYSEQDHLLGGIFLIKTTIGLLAHREIYKAVFASFHLLWCFMQVECTYSSELQRRR